MTSLLRATWPARAARAGPYPYFGQDAKRANAYRMAGTAGRSAECGVALVGLLAGCSFPFRSHPAFVRRCLHYCLDTSSVGVILATTVPFPRRGS